MEGRQLKTLKKKIIINLKRAKNIIIKIKKSWRDLKANYIWLKKEQGTRKAQKKNNPEEKNQSMWFRELEYTVKFNI